MWIKLTGEYVNLDHIVRVKASKSFKAGLEEWVVELEGIIKGELQYFTRYRGVDAEIVLHALNIHSQLEPTPPRGANTSGINTIHDVKVM